MLTRTAQKLNKSRFVGFSRSKKPVLVSKSQVKQMIKSSQAEVTDKYLTVVMENGVTPVLAGSLIVPVLPAQGVTSSTRTGDSVSLDEIQMRFVLTNETGTAADLFRIIVVQSRALNTITIAEVLDTGASSGIDLTSFVNAYSLNTEFHLLHNKMYRCSNSSTDAAKLIELNLIPKIKKINFTSGTTTAEAGQIYVIVQGGAGGASDIIATSTCRYKFHDL
jgi:hypothetical protein